jgi:hypothetical protein
VRVGAPAAADRLAILRLAAAGVALGARARAALPALAADAASGGASGAALARLPSEAGLRALADGKREVGRRHLFAAAREMGLAAAAPPLAEAGEEAGEEEDGEEGEGGEEGEEDGGVHGVACAAHYLV